MPHEDPYHDVYDAALFGAIVNITLVVAMSLCIIVCSVAKPVGTRG